MPKPKPKDGALRVTISLPGALHKKAIERIHAKDYGCMSDYLQSLIRVDIHQEQERTCIWCGCTDSRACPGGCGWAITHTATVTGVCTRCVPKEIKTVDNL